jgi:hypothetical protein
MNFCAVPGRFESVYCNESEFNRVFSARHGTTRHHGGNAGTLRQHASIPNYRMTSGVRCNGIFLPSRTLPSQNRPRRALPRHARFPQDDCHYSENAERQPRQDDKRYQGNHNQDSGSQHAENYAAEPAAATSLPRNGYVTCYLGARCLTGMPVGIHRLGQLTMG